VYGCFAELPLSHNRGAWTTYIAHAMLDAMLENGGIVKLGGTCRCSTAATQRKATETSPSCPSALIRTVEYPSAFLFLSS